MSRDVPLDWNRRGDHQSLQDVRDHRAASRVGIVREGRGCGHDNEETHRAEKIEETGAQGMKDFGRVMKAVMASVASRADGSVVSAMVKKVMSDQS